MFGASYKAKNETYFKLETRLILKSLKSARPANGSTKQIRFQGLIRRHRCRIIRPKKNTPSPKTLPKKKFFIKISLVGVTKDVKELS